MNIHMNSIVRVKLTEFGLHELRKRFGENPPNLYGNYWTAPLWRVMAVLGGYTYHGSPTNEPNIFASSVFASLDIEIINLA